MTNSRETRLQRAAAEIAAEDAWEAGETGFLSPYLINCTLPHKDPGTDTFERSVPWMKLTLYAKPGAGLPYGAMPRLHIAHVITRSIQERIEVVELAPTLTGYARELGANTSAPSLKRLQNMLHRCRTTTWEAQIDEDTDHGEGRRTRRRVEKEWKLFRGHEYTYDPDAPDQGELFRPTVYLTPEFCAVLWERSGVPFDMRALRALSGSSLAQDFYLWATLKAQSQSKPGFYPFTWLMQQFGSSLEPGSREGRKVFKRKLATAAAQVLEVWPELRIDMTPRRNVSGLRLETTRPHVSPRERTLVAMAGE